MPPIGRLLLFGVRPIAARRSASSRAPLGKTCLVRHRCISGFRPKSFSWLHSPNSGSSVVFQRVIAGVKRSEYQRCESASPSFLGNLLSLSRKTSRNLRLPSGVGDRSRADFMNQIAAPIVRHAEVCPPPTFLSPVQKTPYEVCTLAPPVGVASLIASTGGLTRNHAT